VNILEYLIRQNLDNIRFSLDFKETSISSKYYPTTEDPYLKQRYIDILKSFQEFLVILEYKDEQKEDWFESNCFYEYGLEIIFNLLSRVKKENLYKITPQLINTCIKDFLVPRAKELEKTDWDNVDTATNETVQKIIEEINR
jgi:hypothetical protein